MITLTSKAQEKIREIADSEGVKLIVRVKILAGGCSGFGFDMEFTDVVLDTDQSTDIDDIKIISDEMSSLYLDGIMVDYVENGVMGGGFKFSGGEIKSRCGCGNSVGF